MSVMLPSGKLSVERQNMKLKQKKAPNVRKALSAKVAKRSNPTKSPAKFSLIKARVVAVRPARKPALPGKGAVLVALKKKERAAEVAVPLRSVRHARAGQAEQSQDLDASKHQ